MHKSFCLLVLAAVGAATTYAATPLSTTSLAKMQVMHLKGGPNHLDFDGDGVPDLVFVARRENFNAHGVTLTTFYAETATGDGSRIWSVAPLFEKNGREHDSFGTSEGADCILGDMVLLRPSPEAPVVLVTAERPLGNSFVDSQPVKFGIYQLRRNTDGLVGWPTLYFQEVRSFQSAKPYCDVDTAMTRELGIHP
ncbi:MAG: carbapenem self-resistance protein CarG family protein [Rhodanobacteraceae bacterium]